MNNLKQTNTDPSKRTAIDVLKELKTILPADQFIITGSYALAKYGLTPESRVKDLDIILVNPTEVAKAVVAALQKDFPASTHASGENDLMGIFMLGTYKVDVFNGSTEPSLEIEGMLYATIPHIIGAKKRQNRLKDWMQLRTISRFFCKAEDFTNFINNQPL